MAKKTKKKETKEEETVFSKLSIILYNNIVIYM